MVAAKDQCSEQMRRNTPPQDGEKGYVDQFWIGMFSTLCSFAQSESRLIWMRYSAFLIVHGLLLKFILDSMADKELKLDHLLLLFASALGLLFCGVWAYLNHCGWANQNLFLWYAWRLKFSMGSFTPPTEAFEGVRPPAPGDSIYWTAQLLPFAFGVADCFGIYKGSDEILTSGTHRFVASIGAGASVFLVLAVFCRRVQGRSSLLPENGSPIQGQQ